ncbi:MAG: hypothetical protein HQL14_04965 [Candidatus Omnitrophica bacterium]|nr:hypothetical protein [Candidatus Omnitrophota bacterium]
MPKDKKNLLVFGYGLGIIALIFSIGGYIKHGLGTAVIVLLLCSVIFIGVTALNWMALKPGYQAWMKAAHLIGLIVTTVILSIIFLLIFTPISFILRFMGRDHLQRDFSRQGTSYWEKRNQTAFRQEQYHNQF